MLVEASQQLHYGSRYTIAKSLIIHAAAGECVNARAGSRGQKLVALSASESQTRQASRRIAAVCR